MLSKIRQFIPLGICVLIVAIANVLFSPVHVMFQRLIIFVLLMLSLGLIKNRSLRLFVALLPVLMVAWDITLTFYARGTFGSAFSYGFAMSVLDSDTQEISAMLWLYQKYCFGFLALVILLLRSVVTIPTFSGKWLAKSPLYLLILLILSNIVQATAHNIKKNSQESIAARVINYLPISNAKYFLQAWNDQRLIKQIASQTPDYSLQTQETGIDTYVLVIGESARSENMSIYGYPQPTTPQLEAERSHLLLWNHAISGAPITITAVPLAITADTVRDHNIQHYSDNIINLANQAGFDTSWFSKQGMLGDYNNAITGIAMNAAHKHWVNDGYDDALLPDLRKALNHQGKQLIVLHIYGSHEPECTRFPSTEALFTPQSDGIDACYDNSIRFTDKLLGNIFALLKDRRASVAYFSDHALEREPTQSVAYHHGGVKPSQHAFEVPMFIWYSPQVNNPDTGTVEDIYSTVNNDKILRRWMGISLPGDRPEETVQHIANRLAGKAPVMDTTNQIYNWKELAH